jgi:hypothetical protein
MNELIGKVSSEAGISEEQARIAVNCMSAYLKERMPGFLQSQMDPILNGKSWDDSLRDQAQGIGEEVKNRADSLAKDLKEAFDKAFGKKG